MATATINYAAAASVTITVTSLGDGGYRESTAVDNTTNKYVDAQVGGQIQIGAPTAAGYIAVYAYGTYDGTKYTAGVTGTDGTITWGTTGETSVSGFSILKQIDYIDTASTDDNEYVTWGPVSVAQAFGGAMPSKWGVIIRNQSGASLNATGTNNECQFIGVKYDIA